MYQLKYKFNGCEQFREFDTPKAFEAYFLSVSHDEQQHILDNCDLLNQAIQQNIKPDLRAFLIMGFHPYKKSKGGFTPVALARNFDRKDVLAILCMLIDPEERRSWMLDGRIKDPFGLIYGDDPTLGSGAVPGTAVNIPPTALTIAGQSWVERTRSEEKSCCQIM
jgi:hypothetical protein